jgi:hypothetical protein
MKRSKAIAKRYPKMAAWVSATFEREADMRSSGQEVWVAAADIDADVFLIRADACTVSMVGWVGLPYAENFDNVMQDMWDLREKTGTPHIIMGAWQNDVLVDEYPFAEICRPPTPKEKIELMRRGWFRDLN